VHAWQPCFVDITAVGPNVTIYTIYGFKGTLTKEPF
jgi:hypothetical protein